MALALGRKFFVMALRLHVSKSAKEVLTVKKMKTFTTLVASVLVATLMSLSVAGCASEDPGAVDDSQDKQDQTDVLEVSSGPLTVTVPKDWVKFDKTSDPESIKDPWVVGARDSDTEMTTQLRLTKNTGESPHVDATNQAVLYGNVLGNSAEISPKGVENVDVEGADEAQVAYFEVKDADGDYWNGLFMSAGNRETGNVSTMELISFRGEGFSQDDAKNLIANATYDKSKE